MKTPICGFEPLFIDKKLITEALQKGNGIIQIKGVLQRADAVNQNGRVYPKAILEREVEKYMQLVQERRALGELDHPESTVVNLRNVSHNIVEVHWEGNDLHGTIEILTTPSGNIVKELIKNGIKLGVSSRGTGSVFQIDKDTVQVDEDFGLICFDIVSNPSTHGAFLAEGVDIALAKAKHDRINGLVVEFLSELGR